MTLNRRKALQALAGLAIAPRLATAQPVPASVPRIGLLIAGPASGTANRPIVEAFQARLRELGHIEGRNIVYEPRFADGKRELLREAAAEFVRMPVAAMVAFGPGPTEAARAATKTIPIVMGNNDAVERGLITSLAQPSGNITGWSFSSPEVASKQMQLLKEAVPRLSRVGVLTNPDSPGSAGRMGAIEAAASALGLRLHAVDVAKAEGLEPAIAAALRAKIEGMVVLPEPMLLDQLRVEITTLAARHRLPSIYLWRSYAEMGGMMSYGPSLVALAKRMAYFVDRILKGQKPADLPVERPLEYEFVINQKAAAALGLTIPRALELTATDIIR